MPVGKRVCPVQRPTARASRPIHDGSAAYPERMGSERIQEALGAETHRIVGRQAGLGLRLLDRPACRCVVQIPCVERDREHLRRARDQADPLVQVDELGERRDREALVAVDDPLVRPCGRARSACGAEPWRSPSVTPEYAG